MGRLGKTFTYVSGFKAAECFRYYGGWADKIHGKVIKTTE